jgi:hypothetical protein
MTGQLAGMDVQLPSSFDETQRNSFASCGSFGVSAAAMAQAMLPIRDRDASETSFFIGYNPFIGQ